MESNVVIKALKEKWLYALGYLYLFSSIAIFLIGNVKLFISLPLTCILFIAIIKAINNSPKIKLEYGKVYKKILVILAIIIIWVIFAGVGGFVWQNIWDHKFRNAVFMDLVNYDWPVIEEGKALCYYLGYWLPAALVGKIFGLQAGYAFQVIWAILGVSIAFGIICEYLRTVKIRNIIILIFYSGLDIFLFLLFSKLPIGEALIKVFQGRHIELATTFFNSSSNTTLIFWLYNQIIPFWVGMMLLLQQKNSKSIALIYSMMMLYSPFPLVALAPIMVYMVFKKQEGIEENNILKNIFMKIKKACSFENIVSIFLVVIIGLYIKSNTAAGKISFLEINSETIIKYICYIFFEFIVYLVFIYKNHRKDWVLNILILVTFLLPFILMGNSYDFAYRTCIPLAFYIMLLVMKDLQDKNVSKKIKIGIIIVLCLGAITPVSEMIRTTVNEIKVIQGETRARSDSLASAFKKEGNECYDNFIANTDSLFYRYLTK